MIGPFQQRSRQPQHVAWLPPPVAIVKISVDAATSKKNKQLQRSQDREMEGTWAPQRCYLMAQRRMQNPWKP